MYKVSKGAKIRNQYNQVPSLTQDTNGKVTNSKLDTTNESQEVRWPQGTTNRRSQRHSKHKTEKNIKDPQKKYRLGTVSKTFYWRVNVLLNSCKQNNHCHSWLAGQLIMFIAPPMFIINDRRRMYICELLSDFKITLLIFACADAMFCLFWFFKPQSTIFQQCWNRSSWVEPVLHRGKVLCSWTQCSPPVRFEPATPHLDSSTLPLNHHPPLALMLYILVNNFSVIFVHFPIFLSWASAKQRIRCLAKWHNTVPSVSLKSWPFNPKSNTLATKPLPSYHAYLMDYYVLFSLKGPAHEIFFMLNIFVHNTAFHNTTFNQGLHCLPRQNQSS